MFVPVKTKDGQVLMPMRPARARKLIQRGEATPYWDNGIYCIRLNKEPSDRETQEIAIGVDPGSKKEGFTVKSESHTYLNVQADAHNKVGKKVEKRRELRRGKRSRKCPNRKNRMNRLANKQRIPAGTRARWDWKLRILDWLAKIYPVTHVCVEDIKARTQQYQKKWNKSFSPLEIGKALYCHRKFGPLSKTRLWYNIHLLERSIRWRNENEETSLPSLKPKLFLRLSAVKVPKQKCVGDITSAMNNFQSGSDSFLKMRRPSLNPLINSLMPLRSESPNLSNLLGG